MQLSRVPAKSLGLGVKTCPSTSSGIWRALLLAVNSNGHVGIELKSQENDHPGTVLSREPECEDNTRRETAHTLTRALISQGVFLVRMGLGVKKTKFGSAPRVLMDRRYLQSVFEVLPLRPRICRR